MGQRAASRVLFLTVTLAFAGCRGGDAPGRPSGPRLERDAGPSPELMELPGCDDGEPDLVLGFTLARDVDYVADRLGERTLSERGVPCSGAPDAELCQGALARAGSPFRHLVTTERGAVRVWEGGNAPTLFDVVDTAAEVAWVVGSNEYHVPCSARFTQSMNVFRIYGVEARWGCTTAQAIITISVTPDGQFNELDAEPVPGALCEPSFEPGGGFAVGPVDAGARPPPPPSP